MSATLTLVSTKPANPIPTLVLHLESLPPQKEVLTREIIAEALDNLTFIASQFTHYGDPLSNKLHQWCIEVISQFDENQTVDPEYIEDIALRIHELTHEILINPIDKRPLLNPILVNDELPVWERRMWTDYQNICELPDQEGRIHEFALLMLTWRNELPIAELNPTIEYEHAVFKPLQKLLGSTTRVYLDEGFFNMPPEERIITYIDLKAKAIMRQELQDLQAEMQKGVRTLRALWEDAKLHIAQMTAEIAEREQQHTEKLRKSIINMENSYRAEAAIMKQHIDSLRNQLNDTAARLAASQNELVQQAGALRSLRATMAQLAAQNESNRRNARRRGCIIS